MTTLKRRFDDGLTFDEFVFTAKENADLMASVRSRATVPPEYAARIAATGRTWHLLIISEDWCGDGVNILPWIDALAVSSEHLEVRVIERDRNLDLMDAHLTNGRSRSIPVVLLLDDSHVERSWWGPRPEALQRWFMSDEAQAMEKSARYRELRRFYARDRGRSILEELTAMIEEAAAQDAASPVSLKAAV